MGNAEENKKNLLKNVADKVKGNKQKGKKKGKQMFSDKRLNIMVNKIGISEQDANWCINIHKKYAIWIANQIKANPDLKRREGDFRLILDWKREEQQLNLNDYTFETALQTAREAHGMTFKENPNSLKNTNVVLDLGDLKWVQLITAEDCKEEGSAMGHCIGGNGHASSISSGRSVAFSLRDEYNRPHLTLEADINGRVFEFKGRSNKAPAIKYVEAYVALAQQFAERLGEVTDYTFTEALKKNIEVAQRINAVNSRAIPQRMKMQLGLNMFNEGELYMQNLIIGDTNAKPTKSFKIPKELSIYGSLQVVSNEVTIQDGVRVGGSMTIKGRSHKIGKDVVIGGNIKIEGNFKIPKGMKVCGDIILSESMKKHEKAIRDNVLFGGRLIFGKIEVTNEMKEMYYGK